MIIILFLQIVINQPCASHRIVRNFIFCISYMEVNKEIKSQNIRATAPLFSPLGGGMSEDTFEVFIMSAEV